MKRWIVEMVDPHAIGRGRSFIVLAVAQSLLQTAMGKVGPSPLTLGKPRCNFDGITVDPVPTSPPDQHNPPIWEYPWIDLIIIRCLLPPQ